MGRDDESSLRDAKLEELNYTSIKSSLNPSNLSNSNRINENTNLFDQGQPLDDHQMPMNSFIDSQQFTNDVDILSTDYRDFNDDNYLNTFDDNYESNFILEKF